MKARSLIFTLATALSISLFSVTAMAFTLPDINVEGDYMVGDWSFAPGSDAQAALKEANYLIFEFENEPVGEIKYFVSTDPEGGDGGDWAPEIEIGKSKKLTLKVSEIVKIDKLGTTENFFRLYLRHWPEIGDLGKVTATLASDRSGTPVVVTGSGTPVAISAEDAAFVEPEPVVEAAAPAGVKNADGTYQLPAIADVDLPWNNKGWEISGEALEELRAAKYLVIEASDSINQELELVTWDTENWAWVFSNLGTISGNKAEIEIATLQGQLEGATVSTFANLNACSTFYLNVRTPVDDAHGVASLGEITAYLSGTAAPVAVVEEPAVAEEPAAVEEPAVVDAPAEVAPVVSEPVAAAPVAVSTPAPAPANPKTGESTMVYIAGLALLLAGLGSFVFYRKSKTVNM